MTLANSSLVHIYACAAIILSKTCGRSGVEQGEEYRDWSLLCDSHAVATSSAYCSLHCLSSRYPWS